MLAPRIEGTNDNVDNKYIKIEVNEKFGQTTSFSGF